MIWCCNLISNTFNFVGSYSCRVISNKSQETLSLSTVATGWVHVSTLVCHWIQSRYARVCVYVRSDNIRVWLNVMSMGFIYIVWCTCQRSGLYLAWWHSRARFYFHYSRNQGLNVSSKVQLISIDKMSIMDSSLIYILTYFREKFFCLESRLHSHSFSSWPHLDKQMMTATSLIFRGKSTWTICVVHSFKYLTYSFPK